MIASTPEKRRDSNQGAGMAHLGTPAKFVLPPITSILGEGMTSPVRPTLPAFSSFATPKTPSYLFPGIRSASTPSLATLPSISMPTPPSVSAGSAIRSTSTTTNTMHTIMGSQSGSQAGSPRDEYTQLTRTRAGSASDADSSICSDTSEINDSMAKPQKRKHVTSPARDFAFISHSPATFPSQEPAIDNASLARRKRRRTLPNELAILNLEFQVGLTPDKTRRVEIAAKVNMTEKAVQIWFQNKRQSLRRMKVSDREVTELPPTPNSSMHAASSGSGTVGPADMPAPVQYVPPAPYCESTPVRPSLVKSESLPMSAGPALAHLSPLRSYSAPNIPRMEQDATNATFLLKMLASSKDDVKLGTDAPELVMNLINKKQPEFARNLAQAATQVRTFKLLQAPAAPRKVLGAVSASALNQPRGQSAKDSQCVQSLLLLKVSH